MILEVKNLEYTYPKAKTPTFSDVNLTMDKGEIMTILGPTAPVNPPF